MNSKTPAKKSQTKNKDESGTSKEWESPASATADQLLLATKNGCNSSNKTAGRPRKTTRTLNDKLKKIMTVKNNRTLINEMNIKPEYVVFQDGRVTTCSLKVDGIHYPSMGRGNTHDEAKENAISNFVKKILFPKLQKNYLESETKKAATDKAMPNGADIKAQENGEMETEEATDNFPYMALASFAVNQLIRQWRADGIVAPIANNESFQASTAIQSSGHEMGATQSSVCASTATYTQQTGATRDNGHAMPEKNSKLERALKMHPVLFLNEVAPELQFECVVAKTTPPHHFEYRCAYKGETYVGVGNNKKTAKAECAKQLARCQFNIPYQ